MRQNHMEVRLVDCMQLWRKTKADGRAPFVKGKVVNLQHLNRFASVSKDMAYPAIHLSASFEIEKPDLILITSIMTYWYLGVKEAWAWREAFFHHQK